MNRLSPSRIPKGSKEGGQFMPKWAAELRSRHANLEGVVAAVKDRLSDKSDELRGEIDARRSDTGALWSEVVKLSERIGTSTPLIIWNIAVLIAIAYLYCKAYVPGTP